MKRVYVTTILTCIVVLAVFLTPGLEPVDTPLHRQIQSRAFRCVLFQVNQMISGFK